MRTKAAAALCGLITMVAAAPAAAKGASLELEFRGQAIVPSGTTFAGTTVGGLSSITHDRRRDVFMPSRTTRASFSRSGSTPWRSTSATDGWPTATSALPA
jgi:hypothetical protein